MAQENIQNYVLSKIKISVVPEVILEMRLLFVAIIYSSIHYLNIIRIMINRHFRISLSSHISENPLFRYLL
jgi:hypothetical protein